MRYFLLMVSVFFAFCPAYVPISGGYYSNQAWTKAQSPYIVTGNAVLFPGYKLSIEPGVKVLFESGASLIIRGEIIAEGTLADSIILSANDSGKGTGRWNGIQISNLQGGKGSFKYIALSQASSALSVQCCGSGGPLTVSHSRFFKNSWVSSSYAGWSMTFDSCVFENNENVFGSADKIITNSIFRNNGYGLNSTERVSVRNCVFTGHTNAALYGGRGTIDSCIIKDNVVGIRPFYEGFTVTHSKILDNDTGIILGNYDGNTPPINHNTINNHYLNAVNRDSYAKNMRYNWWGTKDAAIISAKIIDGHDNGNIGLIHFNPYWADSLGLDTLVDTTSSGTVIGTTLSGSLLQNIALLKSQSPYLVTGTVTLFPGYKLSIEPGVKVLFESGATLIIRGEITAIGTLADSIIFTANDSGKGTGRWNGIQISNLQGGKGSFKYIALSQASSALSVQCCGSGGPLTVSHSRFFKNSWVSSSYAGWSMTFDNCVFENNENVFGSADKIITNSVFRNNGYGLNSTERVSVRNCVFTGHTNAALYGGRGTIDSCIIKDNVVGIRPFYEGFTVTHSKILDNDTGIILGNYDGNTPPINHNTINNHYLNAVNRDSYAKNMRYNWWGTKDAAIISAKIIDGHDNGNIGLIHFNPYWADSLGLDTLVDTTSSSTVIGTTLSGSLLQNIALLKSQSPYLVAGTVVLFPGYKLSIEPGVKVLFESRASLVIRGEIAAEGTMADNIIFTANDSGKGTGRWNGIQISNLQGGKGSFKYIAVSQASSALSVECCGSGGPLTVSHSRFFKNSWVSSSYAGWSMTFDNCVFENNENVFGSADKIITNSVFRNNGYGLNSTERASVRNCVFTGHTNAALYGGRGTVENCLILNNHIGIKAFYEGFNVSKSSICFNDTGIILGNYDGHSGALSNNNIINKQMNIINTGPYNVNITYNWWGTNDTNSIKTKILDGFDDPLLGLVLQPIYLEEIGKNPFIALMDSVKRDTATIHDIQTSASVIIRSTSICKGRLAISSVDSAVQDTLYDVFGCVNFAPSSDLMANFSTASITLSYKDNNISDGEATGLKIGWLHNGKWEELLSKVDTAKKLITFLTDHFSTYAILRKPQVSTEKPVKNLSFQTSLETAPNPFKPSVAIKFSLEKESKVSIIVYDLTGKALRTLTSTKYPQGNFSVSWRGRDMKERPVSPGVYFVRMVTGSNIFVRKINLL